MRHHQCPAGGAASTSSGPGRVGCGMRRRAAWSAMLRSSSGAAQTAGSRRRPPASSWRRWRPRWAARAAICAGPECVVELPSGTPNNGCRITVQHCHFTRVVAEPGNPLVAVFRSLKQRGIFSLSLAPPTIIILEWVQAFTLYIYKLSFTLLRARTQART